MKEILENAKSCKIYVMLMNRYYARISYQELIKVLDSMERDQCKFNRCTFEKSPGLIRIQLREDK